MLSTPLSDVVFGIGPHSENEGPVVCLFVLVSGGQAAVRTQYVSGLRMKRRSSSFLIHFSSLMTADTARALVARGLKQR